MGPEQTPETLHIINFLRRLAEDGYLTGEEVWHLAKFLNQPVYQEAWPGNVLFPLLRNVFEDGKLSCEEMRDVGDAMTQIEEEWSNRVCKHLPYAEDEEYKGKVWKPELPSLERESMVQCGLSNDQYQVKLSEPTCSCGDWVAVRAPKPVRHLARCCHHVAAGYLQAASETPWNPDPWLAAILEDCVFRGKGTEPQDRWLGIVVAGHPVLLGGGSGDRITVFAVEDHSFQRFIYHRPRRHWLFEMMPDHPRPIVAALEKYF